MIHINVFDAKNYAEEAFILNIEEEFFNGESEYNITELDRSYEPIGINDKKPYSHGEVGSLKSSLKYAQNEEEAKKLIPNDNLMKSYQEITAKMKCIDIFN